LGRAGFGERCFERLGFRHRGVGALLDVLVDRADVPDVATQCLRRRVEFGQPVFEFVEPFLDVRQSFDRVGFRRERREVVVAVGHCPFECLDSLPERVVHTVAGPGMVFECSLGISIVGQMWDFEVANSMKVPPCVAFQAGRD